MEKVPDGWCMLSTLAPTKVGGYIQVSIGGVNKAVLLGELCLWSSGRVLHPGEQVSHLCHKPRCCIPGHLTVEGAKENNARKGCGVWVYCKCGCGAYTISCVHKPACIRYCSSFKSLEEFNNSENVFH